jgi:hypothetical protein
VSERLPRPVSARIRDTVVTEDDLLVLGAGVQVLRIHPLAGDHPLAWDQLRSWGPTRGRFDHHTLPRRHHPVRRIAYLTWGPNAFVAALAEYFQDEAGGVGPIDRTHRRPAAPIITLAAQITLLNLDGGWVTRAGGNQAIRTGPRGVARDWSRAIYRHHQYLQGLAYSSSVWGPGRCVALWERAEAAFPATPDASRNQDDPRLADAIADAAEQLGTYTV